MIGIYKIENKVNNKCYIGQSKDIHKRWADHLVAIHNQNQPTYEYPLYRALRKYGVDNFNFEIIEECSISELNAREEYWISYYNSWKDGYNQNPGGQNGAGGCKLNGKEVEEIQQRLLTFDETKDSHFKIAQDYNVSIDTIQAINVGRVWLNEHLTYPLHTSKYDSTRQSKQKFYCVDCGQEISRGSTRCNVCAGKVRRTAPPVSREELKELIYTTSFMELGRRFGITDNSVRKWCVKMGLPSKTSEIKKYSREEWDKI